MQASSDVVLGIFKLKGAWSDFGDFVVELFEVGIKEKLIFFSYPSMNLTTERFWSKLCCLKDICENMIMVTKLTQ